MGKVFSWSPLSRLCRCVLELAVIYLIPGLIPDRLHEPLLNTDDKINSESKGLM